MPTDSRALVGPAVIQVLQFTLVALGVAASIYAAYRVSRRRYPAKQIRQRVVSPFIVLIVGFGLLNVWMFALPMLHRV